jgi:HlyD family secretion protein
MWRTIDMTVQTKKRGIAKTGAVLILIIAVIIGGWWTLFQPRSAASIPRYLFAEVERGNLEITVSSTGTLAAVETVEIGTQVSGTIEEVNVDYNDQVTKGQVLAVINQDMYKAALNNAKANVLKAEAELKQAEAEYNRNQPLFAQGYIAEQEFLPLNTAVATTQAALQSAKASLLQARINLGHTVISSPISGTVIDRSVDAGQTVAASLSTPTLFLIAEDLAQMQIETQVDETDIGQIRVGQQVRFEVQSYPDEIFPGKVRQIRLQPSTVDNVVTYTVIVDASNASGKLMPGMTATVDFIVYQSEDVLMVPVAALQFTPDVKLGKNSGHQVFLPQEDGRLRPLIITAGESDGMFTEISAEELAAGMKVAIGIKQQGAETEDGEGFSLFGFMNQGQTREQGGPSGGQGGGPGGGGGGGPQP